VWLDWDFIARENEKENEVIGSRQKPQSQVRKGGGAVLRESIYFSAAYFFSQLFPHMLVWFACKAVRRKSERKRGGGGGVRKALYCIFHPPFQTYLPPAQQELQRNTHTVVLGLFLYSFESVDIFVLLCVCVCVCV